MFTEQQNTFSVFLAIESSSRRYAEVSRLTFTGSGSHPVDAVQVEQYLIKTEDIHEDFRLWITAEPHPNFPIGLLQMGIKITNEAPVGMKAGLRASYQWVSQVSLAD